MRLVHIAVFIGLILVVQRGSTQPLEASVGGFEGIWEKCYAPGLEGVYEIDSGFLVLMPAGEYYDASESCCSLDDVDPKPPFWERNVYRVEGEVVVLTSHNYSGRVVERRLVLREQRETVLFDEPRGAPRLRDVLAGANNDSLSYGYCRVYPSWPVRDAPHNNPLVKAP